MKISYYLEGQSYVAVTNQSPAGFKDVVFVGRDASGERLFAYNQIEKLTPVAKDQVPDEWRLKLGYEPQVVTEELPIFDEAGDELQAEIPVRRIVTYVSPAEQARADREVAIGFVIGIFAVLGYLILKSF